MKLLSEALAVLSTHVRRASGLRVTIISFRDTATGKVITTVCAGTAKDVDLAVEAATKVRH